MPLERRHRLTAASAAEFAERGFENASLNAIITRCGMSKSSFYYLFESKEQLFEFVVDELLRQFAEAVPIPSPHDFAGGDFWLRVESLFAEVVQAAAADPSLLALGRMFYASAPAAARGPVTATLLRARGWLQELVRLGRAGHVIRDDLPESLQTDLAFAMLRTFDEWSVTNLDSHADAEAWVAAQFAALKRVFAVSV